jgi:predicted transcriptional regulator
LKKNLDKYGEILYYLINFRLEQYKDSKSMIGVDFDSFMIMSCIGSHYIRTKTKEGSNWDSIWEQTRTEIIDKHLNSKKLTIFAVSNLVNLPKETVRRKIEILKKKKLISYSRNDGLLPTEKTEELMKPFATKELKVLANFLKALKKNKSLDQLLNF